MATTDTDTNQCPHMLNLGTRGWGVALRCTLNRGHRGVHVGPVYDNGPAWQRHVLAPDVTALEWRTDNLDHPDVAGGRLTASRGGDFPGTDLDLDLLTVVARIEQCHAEGIDTAGGTVWDRLLTCDVPRLRRHIAPAALEWADRVSSPWGRVRAVLSATEPPLTSDA